MEKPPKSAKQQLLQIAGETLLEKLKEYKENRKKASESGVSLLDEVNNSEMVSESVGPREPKGESVKDSNASSKELVRYHSVVEINEFDDEFGSCRNSLDNIYHVTASAEFDEIDKDGELFKKKDTDVSEVKVDTKCPPPKNEGMNQELSNFVQKKSIAQGMMDLALVSANTNQLRYVMDLGDKHPYFFTSLTLIITSLVMQLIVGLAMIFNSRYNIRKKNEMREADRINDLSVIGIFLITLINVFISTFNGSNAGSFSSGEVFTMAPSNVSSTSSDLVTSTEGSLLDGIELGSVG
ncbi:uncharacterized protein LOC129752476 [Uranotaenia lowii]|uniref:uncharacterized protein LOC129752476 n=1 Tax=Uranotaenia lowii TaxID=190385 RepID=UPI0024795930|nr:uncharacterized protein LOC129752476 [Uranotaenia lowii]